ncbi:MAG: hypothetical protein AAGA21_23165 [Pseudomonadota bacterium]
MKLPAATIGLSLCMVIGLSLIDPMISVASLEHDQRHRLEAVGGIKVGTLDGHLESLEKDLPVIANAVATRQFTIAWRDAGKFAHRPVIARGKTEMISQTNRIHSR